MSKSKVKVSRDKKAFFWAFGSLHAVYVFSETSLACSSTLIFVCLGHQLSCVNSVAVIYITVDVFVSSPQH